MRLLFFSQNINTQEPEVFGDAQTGDNRQSQSLPSGGGP